MLSASWISPEKFRLSGGAVKLSIYVSGARPNGWLGIGLLLGCSSPAVHCVLGNDGNAVGKHVCYVASALRFRIS